MRGSFYVYFDENMVIVTIKSWNHNEIAVESL